MADMASELEAAAVRLRRAGQDGLARELTAAMRRGVAPVPDQIRAGLKPHLPDRYAETLAADLDIRTIARPGSATTDAVVSVYAQSRTGTRKLKRLDAGRAHPSPSSGTGSTGTRRQARIRAWCPAGSPAPARRRSPGSAPSSSRHWKTSAAKQPDRRLPSRSPWAARRSSTTGPRRPCHEALWVEHVYKRRYAEWQEDLSAGSAKAMCVLACLIWRRDGRDVPLQDLLDGTVDFDLMEMLTSMADAAKEARRASRPRRTLRHRRPRLAHLRPAPLPRDLRRKSSGSRPWEIGALETSTDFEALIDAAEEMMSDR